MTEKLTPVRCGCGGEAAIRVYESLRLCKQTDYYVQCKECGIATLFKNTEAEAIKIWNRAMRRAKVDILPNTCEDKGEMPFCPHCGDELEWE